MRNDNNEDFDVLTPCKLIKYLKKTFTDYTINEQQDSQEILFLFLEKLHNELPSIAINWDELRPYIQSNDYNKTILTLKNIFSIYKCLLMVLFLFLLLQDFVKYPHINQVILSIEV